MTRLAWIALAASATFSLGALLYCSPTATVEPTDAGVCDPDSGTNCPCDPNTYKPAACYSGPKGTNGKGICKAGTRKCVAGKLTACEGEVLPEVETCNLADDDCNQITDDVPEFKDAAPIAYCTSPACSPTFTDAAIECFGNGQGICGAGKKACEEGTAGGKPTGCQPFIKKGVPEECNGWDDDCNGQVDDLSCQFQTGDWCCSGPTTLCTSDSKYIDGGLSGSYKCNYGK